MRDQANESFIAAANRKILCSSDEEWIRTCLGDNHLEITFAPSLPGPFYDAPIECIALPVWWRENANPSELMDPTLTDGGGFACYIGARRFRYDQARLRQLG